MNKKIFTERRSVNFFDTSRELDKETFNSIMDLASLTPSSFNLQPWRVIAVHSEKEKERLLPLAWNQPKIKEAPYTLIIIGDKSGFKENAAIWNKLEEGLGKETADKLKGMAEGLYGTSDERMTRFALTNGSLLAMSIMYAAKAFGVDSHTMSGIDYEAIKKEYKLNDSEEVVLLVSLGYHDNSKELYPRGYRKTGSEFIEVI